MTEYDGGPGPEQPKDPRQRPAGIPPSPPPDVTPPTPPPAAIPPTPPPAAIPPVWPAAATPPTGPPPIPGFGGETTAPPPKKRRTGLFVAGALVVAAIGGGAYVAASDGDDDDAAPTTTAPVATTVVPEPSSTEAAETTVVSPPADATVAELARSTVQVILLDGGQPTCTGSGTFVDTDGTILTNAHVVDPAGGCGYDTIGIAITDDAGRPPILSYEADIHAYDDVLDLAVLRIVRDSDGNDVAASFPAVPIGDSDSVQIGDQLRILGYPGIGGDTITFTNGVVSGFTSQNNVADRSWIKTDATIAGGNSGGSAFDSGGRLIGVPTQASASDTGPVVDCRVIADTNGDGFFDDDDQCVPIGGFLNGIRPVNLAVPLLLEARTSTPIVLDQLSTPTPPTDFDPASVRIFNPGWSLSASDDAEFVPEFVVTAAEGATALCIWFDWEGIPDGVMWDGVWLVDGEVNDSYSFFGEPWELGLSGFDNWVCALDEDGLTGGVYEFAFLVNEEVQFIESIRVTPEPVPVHTVTFLNSSGSTVCYLYVAPFGASDTGLDELGADQVFETGLQFELGVAEGAIVVDAYDCEFNPLLVDYDGISVTGDLSIEITG